MMSGNPTILDCNSEGSVSSSSKGGMESESHYFLSFSGGSESEIIILSDDSEMEGFPGESPSDEVLSMSNSESLFPVKFGRGENLTERPMSPPILTKE